MADCARILESVAAVANATASIALDLYLRPATYLSISLLRMQLSDPAIAYATGRRSLGTTSKSPVEGSVRIMGSTHRTMRRAVSGLKSPG